MTGARTPPAEVDIDGALVRRLLEDQHPDLASRSLVEVGSGWDNAIYRLGDDLLVRLPRRAVSAVLVEHEQRWLPRLAPRLPLPIPAPVRAGRPAAGYPWSWSVCPWFQGEASATRPPEDRAAAAETIGTFLGALHAPAPDDAPINPYRGVPLLDRAAVTEERIDQLTTVIDAEAARACWRRAVEVPPWTATPVWLHGDLHPANVLVDNGALAAVIDFGDICAGDPASDLAVGWMMFDARTRSILRAVRGGVDDDLWARAKGWALALALAYLANSADNPVMASIGSRTVTEVLRDPDRAP